MNISLACTNELGTRTLLKVKWKIISFTFLLYFFSVVDRMNLGYAALQMNKDLNISAVDYGTVASLFFVSYFLFQVPSNLILQRSKTNKWIGLLLITWGAVTTATFFVQNVNQLLICRFLLGVFEAGFFPGMMLYFSQWFPIRERAKVTALFMLAASISSAVTAPISGWILEHINWFNYHGWRWLFFLEGVPTIILGIIAIFYMTNKPADAKWLNKEEKEWLINELEKENNGTGDPGSLSLYKILSNGALWKLAFVYMFVQGASQAAVFWLPGIVKQFSNSSSDTQVGIIMALPFICASIAMPIWGAHSDKTNERKYHTALPILLFAVAFTLMAFVDSIPLKILALALYGAGTYSYYGPFWALPGMMLPPAAIAIGVAIINSLSSLSGFFASKIIGFISAYYGTASVLLFSVILCLLSFVLLVTMKVPSESKGKREGNHVA